jgi:putative ABC transport system substrate-binding protein
MTTANRDQARVSSNKPPIVGVLACALLVALCSSAEAQPQKKVPRIGYLASDSRAPTLETFRQGLRDFGYIEGQSIQIEWRFTEDNTDRFPELAAELARLKVDAIVAGYSAAVPILQHTTSTIPIVMTNYGGDPVADGLVTSYAKPGGNITGVISLAPELNGKQLEVLKETLVKLSRVAVMWDPDDSGSRLQWQLLQTPARRLGAHLLSLEVKAPTELDKAIENMERAPVDALVVLRGGPSYLLRKQIVALTVKHRLPGMYFASEFVEAGG